MLDPTLASSRTAEQRIVSRAPASSELGEKSRSSLPVNLCWNQGSGENLAKHYVRNGISGSERLLYDRAKESTIMRARWCASTKRACLSRDTENVASRAEPGVIFG